MPERENFSTPESAYAVINRVLAGGKHSRFAQISVKSLADRMVAGHSLRDREVRPETSEQYLSARIIEVRIFRNSLAAVIAELPRKDTSPAYDLRSLAFENGKWLNRGQSIFDTPERARTAFARACSFQYQNRPLRPKIPDPRSHIRPFIEFLKDRGGEPKAFVAGALARHKVVIIGEIHHRPRYWAFNSSLVTDPDFPEHVGTVYLELPSNDQPLVDKFLASGKCDTAPLIEMLRDNLWMGWPDQAMLDFFITVWTVNQHLDSAQRIRIVLVDMQRPWARIQNRRDWRQYDVDRDRFMAESIVGDISEHADEKRNCLFIVGVGHTALNLRFVEGTPLATAGRFLREQLGPDGVYAVFQHRPIQTNTGRVDGRLCLGLFDAAFAALGKKPIAFPLDVGPLGEEPYDADPERPVSGAYADGFNAYLYLGPLETEIFSPLIAGFYTEAFVKELDRRHRMMFASRWAESYGRDRMDAESFIAWMAESWGKPRGRWQNDVLGPIDAWRYGDNWKMLMRDEKLEYARENPDTISNVAREFFDSIRSAHYEDYLDPNGRVTNWGDFPTADRYTARQWHDELVRWICTTLRDNPIESVDLGVPFKDGAGRPAVPYKLTLKDARILEGDLPFDYDPRAQRWRGIEGINWHLRQKSPGATSP